MLNEKKVMVNKLYASRGGRQVYDILISETPLTQGGWLSMWKRETQKLYWERVCC